MMRKTWDVISTVRDTEDRLTLTETLSSSGLSSRLSAVVQLNPRKQYQSILGFGGAFTESAANTFYRLPAEKQKEVLSSYFDPHKGHGYTLCRTHINSCDFSLGHYAYAEVPDDWGLDHFSIERDRQYLLPMIQSAFSAVPVPLKLLASPWSPPAWMKTNGKMARGGKLRDACRQVWADYYVRYIQAYAEAGVPVWGVSVQNEPMAVQSWDSCIYTAQEERNFVRDYLGPTLAAQDLSDVRIVVWDHNRDLMFKRARAILRDSEAAKYVWGVGFHWYETPNRFKNLEKVHHKFPDVHLLFTEGCQEGGVHLGEWGLGERYAHNMINDLNHWTVGWIDWNMLLDEQGGPNHVGNYCSAQIIGDTQTGELHYQSSYYYFGHIARYVQPGAVRIGSSVRGCGLECAAFQNPDGRLAVIVLNRSDSACRFDLVCNDASARVVSPPHSILTLVG